MDHDVLDAGQAGVQQHRGGASLSVDAAFLEIDTDAVAGSYMNQPWLEVSFSSLVLNLLFTLVVGRPLARRHLVDGATFGLRAHMGIPLEHGGETCPAMLMITSSPAPDSASSVTSVCRPFCLPPP